MSGGREIGCLLSYCPVLPVILVNTTGDTYNDSHCNAQNLVVQSQNLIQQLNSNANPSLETIKIDAGFSVNRFHS
ncbi:hypothetical protein GCM10011450_07930 [Advenella faeciporci]|uniref:Uncharacterized protein n=1 Tax=Advenella faeciporci TaxID=797535 RepID=A0A918MXY2_9BURK|nr:hypothetical protein GCM10011450_07930 [Advenella faeciporci]